MPTPCERRAQFRQSLVALVPVLLGFLTARPCPATDVPAPPERWAFRLTASVMSADYDGSTEFTAGFASLRCLLEVPGDQHLDE